MIKLYNSLTRQIEPLKPLRPKKLGLYVCGPTVYGPSHLGHARTYVSFDALRRFLEVRGHYAVKLIMNITDIHDDILKQARQIHTPPLKLAQQYTIAFLADLKILRVKPAARYPRVTQHLKPIIRLIQKLIRDGYAYETEDGVYFRILKFPSYGRLSGRSLVQARTGTRVRTDKYDKEGASDFALWKKEYDEWMFDSPWGKGRPGWHIECSALAAQYLPQPFDLHGGAHDLIFPHHENEIAQSECAYHKKLANFFLHAGLLNINGQKMSKSLGNYITINDFLTGHTPFANIDFKPSTRFLRFFILSHHWRSPADLTPATLVQVWTNFVKINEAVTQLQNKPTAANTTATDHLSVIETAVWEALENDFNTPLALTELHRLFSNLPTNTLERKKVLIFLTTLDRIFGCFFPWKNIIPLASRKLILKRNLLRKQKKFKEADAARAELATHGYLLADHKTKTLIINLN